MLFLFEFIGLKDVCSFAGVQESDHEGKTKWQSIKIINGKVNTFIKDEDKTELLNEIIGRSKKGVTSKPPGENAAIDIDNDRNKCPSGTDGTGQLTFHSICIDAESKLVREKEADLIRTKQILE